MSISYPISVPSAWKPKRVTIKPMSTVGVTESPFTGEQQIFVNQREIWQAEVEFPFMVGADAKQVLSTILQLNGREGTILFGDTVNTAPAGTWAGAPKVFGAHAAGVKSIAMDGFTAGATVKGGDYFQTGTGSSTHLHMVTKDGTADGSGLLTLEVWPRTRAALSDDATFDTSSPVGIWRLASNEMAWAIGEAQLYEMTFSFVEAL